MEIIKEELTPQAVQGVHTIIKRKRTKRHRLLLPLSAPSPTSTSSTAFSGSTTDEEEDMANCLILLAQGRTTTAMPNPEVDGSCSRAEKFTSRRFAETATTTTGKTSIYVYECKTCNKCFPSFQALGGHRASHKKPKFVAPVTSINEDDLELSMNSLSRPVSVITANTRKVRRHECSICGSEFSSGQALGGHMRRHRPVESPEAKKERSLLSLDLNLPAPSEEERGGELAAGFQFVFSASAMVDCHY